MTMSLCSGIRLTCEHSRGRWGAHWWVLRAQDAIESLQAEGDEEMVGDVAKGGEAFLYAELQSPFLSTQWT